MGNSIVLDEEEQELLFDLCREHDIETRSSYSGRGMFNRSCFGIIGNQDTLVQFLQEVAPRIETVDPKLWRRLSNDNMGLRQIFYWEGISTIPNSQ